MTASRQDNPNRRPAEPEPRAHIPLPADTLVDRDRVSLAHRMLNDWLDEAFAECVKKGGMDNLPGKGKPLVVPTGDPLETILRNNKIPPPWILLRREIRTGMELAVELLETGADPQGLDEQIYHLNRQIAELNLQSPSLSLHRRKVNRDNLREEYAKWE